MGGGGCQQEKPSTVACLLNYKFNRQEVNTCISVLITEDHLQKSLLEACPNAAVAKPLMREHTKREPPLLLCSARCRNPAARDLRHRVLFSANNDAPVGVDGNSSKTTAASEERAHGAVGRDLAHSLIEVVRYDDAAFAIHGNPDREVELRCCTGAVALPDPATVLTVPSGVSLRTRWLLQSAMMMLPSPSTANP